MQFQVVKFCGDGEILDGHESGAGFHWNQLELDEVGGNWIPLEHTWGRDAPF